MSEYRCQVDCPSIVERRWKEIGTKRLRAFKWERTDFPKTGMILMWGGQPELVLRDGDNGRRAVKTQDKEGQVHHRRIVGGVSVIPQLFQTDQTIEERRKW